MGSVKLAGRVAAALTVVALVAAGCGSSSKKALTSPSSATGATSSAGPSASTGSKSADIASAPGVTATTIKIGLLTSITGAASSTFSTSALGAKAYFDAVNKAGGIDGRQIQLVTADDLSSPSGALTATEDLIRQGVFAIISVSSFFYGAYRAAQKAGIPVLGGGFDGPEWGQKPNTNMFAFLGGVDPDHSVVGAGLAAAEMFKSIGVHNVAGLAYGISPSSISSVQDLKTAVGNIGLKMGYENLSLPFGSSDVGPEVLAIKGAGADMVVCACVQSTVLALVTGLKQGGSDAKSLSTASADSSLFSDPSAAAAAQGVYYASQIPPLDIGDSAATTLENNLKAVEPSYVTGTYPTYGISTAYLSAALTVKGLQVAGQNPTRTSYIADLAKVTDWSANGLLAGPVSFNHFGTSEKNYCSFYVHVAGHAFVQVPGGNGPDGAFCQKLPSDL